MPVNGCFRIPSQRLQTADKLTLTRSIELECFTYNLFFVCVAVVDSVALAAEYPRDWNAVYGGYRVFKNKDLRYDCPVAGIRYLMAVWPNVALKHYSSPRLKEQT